MMANSDAIRKGLMKTFGSVMKEKAKQKLEKSVTVHIDPPGQPTVEEMKSNDFLAGTLCVSIRCGSTTTHF